MKSKKNPMTRLFRICFLLWIWNSQQLPMAKLRIPDGFLTTVGHPGFTYQATVGSRNCWIQHCYKPFFNLEFWYQTNLQLWVSCWSEEIIDHFESRNSHMFVHLNKQFWQKLLLTIHPQFLYLTLERNWSQSRNCSNFKLSHPTSWHPASPSFFK